MKSGELWRQPFGEIEPWWPCTTDESESVVPRVPKLWDSDSLNRLLAEHPGSCGLAGSRLLRIQ